VKLVNLYLSFLSKIGYKLIFSGYQRLYLFRSTSSTSSSYIERKREERCDLSLNDIGIFLLRSTYQEALHLSNLSKWHSQQSQNHKSPSARPFPKTHPKSPR
jgi:hypothetical protein